MRILFLADIPSDPNSGAAGTEYHTMKELQELGHEIDAIWRDGIPHRISHGNLHYLLELPLTYRRLMLQRMSIKDFDVIHVNQPHGYLAARALQRMKGKPIFIHRSHGFEAHVNEVLAPWLKQYAGDKRQLSRKIVSRAISRALGYNYRGITRSADGHIVSSSECADFLARRMDVSRNRIAIIPQGVPSAFLSSPARPMSSDRLRRILYVGQFAFVKAPAIVASVLNRLAVSNAELEFTWVCSANDHRAVLALLDAGVRDRIHLLGWMPQEHLIDIYDSHGIFLFPSFFEGFGKAFLEAMSRGLCVVASNNGGARDVITEGLDGFLIPTASTDIAVERCLRVIRDLGLAMRVSRAAAVAAAKYTWRRVAIQTESFYRQTISAKADRAQRGLVRVSPHDTHPSQG